MKTLIDPMTRSCRSKGFTLVEILIAISIIMLLAAILFPVLKMTKSKLQAAQAVQRIKQCGIVVLQKAIDNNNTVVVHANGTSSNMRDLRLYGMMEEVAGEQEVGRYVYTPAYESLASGTWPVWALNFDDAEEKGIKWEKVWFQRGGENRYAEGLNLTRCDSMHEYPLFADSSNGNGVPRARFSNDDQYKFAMRYQAKGPVFFLDGSTQMVGRDDMAKFGITRAYLFKDNPVTEPTLVTTPGNAD